MIHTWTHELVGCKSHGLNLIYLTSLRLLSCMSTRGIKDMWGDNIIAKQHSNAAILLGHFYSQVFHIHLDLQYFNYKSS